MKTLPLNKSSSIEFITSRVLRDSMLEMLTETTFMINECIRCEVMPTKWKVGYVTPMPTGKLVKNPSDWRPVLVCPYQVKLLKGLFTTNLFIILNVIITSVVISMSSEGKISLQVQFLNIIIQFLYDNLDKLNSTSSIFVDYSKAFDTIDHEILIKILLYKFDKNSVK